MNHVRETHPREVDHQGVVDEPLWRYNGSADERIRRGREMP
jgi:hypothetical protein